jgi:streptogramin lyase
VYKGICNFCSIPYVKGFMAYRKNRNDFSRWGMILFILLLASCSPRNPVVTVLPMDTEFPPTPNQIQQRILLPRGAGAVAFGDGSIWVVDRTEHHILRIDRDSGEAAAPSTPLDFEPGKIAYGEGAVWVVSADHTRLARIDSEANKVVAEIDLRPLRIPDHVLLLITAGEGAVWITDQTHVIQIDPGTNQILGEPIPAGEEIVVAALGHGTLWTGSHDDGIISRVDAKTHRVLATIDMGFSVHGLAVSDESAWVLDEHGFAVVRIDPQTNQLQERIPIDFIGANLATGADSVWVAPAARDSGSSTGNDGIAQISEDQLQLVNTVHVGGVPASEYYSVYFSEGSVWVLINTPQPSIVQITPYPSTR